MTDIISELSKYTDDELHRELKRRENQRKLDAIAYFTSYWTRASEVQFTEPRRWQKDELQKAISFAKYQIAQQFNVPESDVKVQASDYMAALFIGSQQNAVMMIDGFTATGYPVGRMD